MRSSILTAVGLVAAGCGPVVDETDSSASGSGSGSDSGSSTGNSATSADTGVVTTATTSQTGDPPMLDCAGSEPILQLGANASVPTGFERCANGVVHRVEPVECLSPLPSGTSCTLTGTGCETDADCTDRAHGRCIEDDFFEPYCGCQYGCASDADCAEGYVCACGGDAADYPASSRCIPAACPTDAACGDSMCALGSGDDGCGISYRASCLTPGDTCTVDADCEGLGDCFPSIEGGWNCEDFCCCGRPFFVDGDMRTAPIVGRDDWCDRTVVPDTTGLGAHTRAKLANHWRAAAAMEHASVASFARSCLELMALGAPPHLLEQTQAAMRDEIDHARRCFALASAYAGARLGPAALDTTGGEAHTDRRRVLEAVVREGCVGETLAAIEARQAWRAATDPAVRATLARIADDELRHALLGWQTLAWALDAADDTLRRHLVTVFETASADAVRAASAMGVDDYDDDAEAHGMLGARSRVDLLVAAVDQVLRPCARALLDGTRPVRDHESARLA